MNTKIKAGAAALLALGTIAASAAPANAYGYRGGYHGYGHYGRGYYGGRGYGGGALLGAGLAGLALGAVVGGSHYGYGYGPRYGYAPGYYGYGYGTCAVRRSVWDPYYGGYVVRRVPVPC